MPLDDDIAHYLTAPDARALVVKLANERKTTNQLVAQLRAENAELKAITNQPPPDPARQFIATFDQLGELRSEAGEGMSNDGVWWVQRNAPGRITVVPGAGAGLNALRLHTEPGDNNIAGSNLAERADVSLGPYAKGFENMEHWGINGKEQWWAHSIMLPDDFLMPPAGWMVLFGFHDDRNQGGQGNVSIFADSNGMSFKGHAGPEIPFDARGNAMSYGGNIVAAVVRRVWFEFVYHVRWSWGRDGFFDAWINGKRKLSHQGPTLYDGYGVYLKLANYHSAFDKPTSVLHRRIVRGSTMRSVTDTTLEGLS